MNDAEARERLRGAGVDVEHCKALLERWGVPYGKPVKEESGMKSNAEAREQLAKILNGAADELRQWEAASGLEVTDLQVVRATVHGGAGAFLYRITPVAVLGWPPA